jgi:Rad3-related DNA helicase
MAWTATGASGADQGNLSKQETLNKHKARVDDGESSVLFGLASFAEGVDLPGLTASTW